MRFPCILQFVLLLCCLTALPSVIGKNEKQASERGATPSFVRSGHFSTKDNHACTWKITGDQSVHFVLSCSQQNQSYECTYEGEPQRCPTYSTNAKQYWKQILGKMKKKNNACEEKTLKSRLCKKGSASDSQMRLVQKIPSSLEEGGKAKGKGKGRRLEAEKVQGPGPRTFSANLAPGPEKKGKGEKPKSSERSDASSGTPIPLPTHTLPAPGEEVKDEAAEVNEDLPAEYCAENWHSLCTFFVNFWNG